MFGKKVIRARVTEDEIADVVRFAREAAGLSQTQLAIRMGIGNSVVNSIERRKGTGMPKLGTMARIAEALGMDCYLEFRPRRET